ncbi:Superoxide dismutase [Blastocystis sp. ATCC 50177/Nand II]|uniref:Superoxide dismutase n=1 Tax=Blastocystis sp. subtype 1 (strain ATCC 50177 / NandII) TaxID=478820 RepID=A0A196S5S2_BLAHN|nr:Superoxide dismutase [Blastocystis sp. ATCC 50177/Nand II]
MISNLFTKAIRPASFVRCFASAAYVLPPLPYSRNALAPAISEETMKCHYDGHHQTYVNNLNNMTKDTERKPLEHYITNEKGPLHNQAAQIWNHSFFWNCMAPKGKSVPEGDFLNAVKRDFGSMEKLEAAFTNTAVAHFGSGWAWLVHDPKSNTLKVMSTANEANPMQQGLRPLLVCDVWEHAYYLDYQFRRPQFIKNWFGVVNWQYVSDVYSSNKIPTL